VTVLFGYINLLSSQGGVALRRSVVNTESGWLQFPGAAGGCLKATASKTFAAMAEVPLFINGPLPRCPLDDGPFCFSPPGVAELRKLV
jgi:hypothetical protein